MHDTIYVHHLSYCNCFHCFKYKPDFYAICISEQHITDMTIYEVYGQSHSADKLTNSVDIANLGTTSKLTANLHHNKDLLLNLSLPPFFYALLYFCLILA